MSSGPRPQPRPGGEEQDLAARYAQHDPAGDPYEPLRESQQHTAADAAPSRPEDLSANARHVLSYLYQQINSDLRAEEEIGRQVGLPPQECALALHELLRHKMIWFSVEWDAYSLTNTGRTFFQHHAAQMHTTHIYNVGDVSGAAVNIGPGFIKAANIAAVSEPFPVSPTHAKTMVDLVDTSTLKEAIRQTVRETLSDEDVIQRIAQELVRQLIRALGVPPATISIASVSEGSIMIVLVMPGNIARHLYDLMPPEKRRPLAHPAPPRSPRSRPGAAALRWLRRQFSAVSPGPAQAQVQGIWYLFFGLGMLLMAGIALALLSTDFTDGALAALSGSMALISLLLLTLYLNNRTYTWAPWAAYIMLSAAVVVGVGFLYEPQVQGYRALMMISGLVALFVSLPFLRAYVIEVWIGRHAAQYWWTILVAGGIGTLVLSLLQLALDWPPESLPGALTASFMGGVTLTLFLLWLPNYRDRLFEWAIWPAIITFVLAVFGGLWAFDVLELALPLLLLLVGVISVIVFLSQAAKRP